MIALVRTEMEKAVRRVRTLVIALGLVALPLFITIAIHARGDRPRRDAGEGLFRLARLSGLVVPALVLAAMSGFLLVVVGGMIAGDAVAGDAASGNLRYLLIRPVSRVKLLIAKAFVSTVLVWVAVVLVMATGLIAGVFLFGWHPVDIPGRGLLTGAGLGLHLSTTMLIWRVLAATAYVAVGMTALLATATFFSTLTDTPAGASGAAIGVYIVSEILDSITELGRLRYALPTHYLDAWQPMFTENRFSHDLTAGVLVQLGYLAVFGGLAIWWFARKDIRS